MKHLRAKMEVRVARCMTRRSINATVHLASVDLTANQLVVSKVNIERNESI